MWNKLLTTSTTAKLMFTQTKHPMAMGMILLTQSTLMWLISVTMYKSFWFSHILFMILIGGMWVLFMYMTSIASNEMFSTSNKSITITVSMYLTISLMMFNPTNNKEMSEFNTMMENEVMSSTMRMYEQTTGNLIFMLVLFTLHTLIVVVKIIIIN